jgi:hypothetical protein
VAREPLFPVATTSIVVHLAAATRKITRKRPRRPALTIFRWTRGTRTTTLTRSPATKRDPLTVSGTTRVTVTDGLARASPPTGNAISAARSTVTRDKSLITRKVCTAGTASKAGKREGRPKAALFSIGRVESSALDRGSSSRCPASESLRRGPACRDPGRCTSERAKTAGSQGA